ncbi:hypothetical protein SEPCBS119000_000635 [Sporothrix epigloea]|uniref:Uncharacterized protein n=1 Tax=Sporothrix epigloea TaxID=1892477 RepID=A0ABP0D6K0_9PEZI
MPSRVPMSPQPVRQTSSASSTTRSASDKFELRHHRLSSTPYPVPAEPRIKSVHGPDSFNASPPKMHRQDSGYASTTSYERPSRSSESTRRPSRSDASSRRAARYGSSISQLPRASKLRSRAPFIHHANTFPESVTPSVYRHNTHHDISPLDNSDAKTAQTSYFQFPSPELRPVPDDPFLRPASHGTVSHDDYAGFPADDSIAAAYHTPPPTTHYWTSDQTRRLEYEAIDAASRGFKGWVMRHMVPDCFVPKAKRRVTFDDDTGSVRRYRIELETDEPTEKTCLSSVGERGSKKGSSSSWWS